MGEINSINDLPFKLRFTSTEKLCKELIKLIHERYETLDKLCTEYETIGEHKQIIGNIKNDLNTTHDALKQLRSLCQCQSDDDKSAVNKQLQNSEELLERLESKFNGIAAVKMCDISVNRLPSNWRATMLRIARENAKKAFNENVEQLAENSEKPVETVDNNNESTNNENNGNKIDNESKVEIENDNDDSIQMLEEIDPKLDETIAKETAEINKQFEIDLERKIYETQIEELMSMVHTLIMQIKTLKARIDISKQLLKVALKLKREYESSNSKLKESLATCHCAEAGADDDQEFQKRMEEKKKLEETIEKVGNELKYWEEQYAILKEGKNKNNNNNNNIENNDNNNQNKTNITTTTIIRAQEESMDTDMMPIPSTSSQQSCMYAGQQQQSAQQQQQQQQQGQPQQGTANPAVIYLEGLVAHQQPTYIPATNLQHPIGMYPHAYTIAHPNPHPYHTAPDGSIQVYSSDISSHPGYIAYQ